MYLNEEAEIWVKKQVEGSIVGNCCSLANEIHFKEDYKNLKEFKSFLKVIFLLKNFNEVLSHNDIVDNHFSRKDNQVEISYKCNDCQNYIHHCFQLPNL